MLSQILSSRWFIVTPSETWVRFMIFRLFFRNEFIIHNETAREEDVLLSRLWAVIAACALLQAIVEAGNSFMIISCSLLFILHFLYWQFFMSMIMMMMISAKTIDRELPVIVRQRLEKPWRCLVNLFCRSLPLSLAFRWLLLERCLFGFERSWNLRFRAILNQLVCNLNTLFALPLYYIHACS